MEIRIGKTARACFQCEGEFVHEQELRSLVRIEDGTLTREDYCTACWDPAFGTTAFSVWAPQYYDPKVAEQEPPEVFSPLRQAFYESVEKADRLELAKAYLAAQLLRRQKVFRRLKEDTDPDAEVRLALYADRLGNNALVEVRDPNLSFAELEAGRERLMARLQELESPEDGEDGEEDVSGSDPADSEEEHVADPVAASGPERVDEAGAAQRDEAASEEAMHGYVESHEA